MQQREKRVARKRRGDHCYVLRKIKILIQCFVIKSSNSFLFFCLVVISATRFLFGFHPGTNMKLQNLFQFNKPTFNIRHGCMIRFRLLCMQIDWHLNFHELFHPKMHHKAQANNAVQLKRVRCWVIAFEKKKKMREKLSLSRCLPAKARGRRWRKVILEKIAREKFRKFSSTISDLLPVFSPPLEVPINKPRIRANDFTSTKAASVLFLGYRKPSCFSFIDWLVVNGHEKYYSKIKVIFSKSDRLMSSCKCKGGNWVSSLFLFLEVHQKG